MVHKKVVVIAGGDADKPVATTFAHNGTTVVTIVHDPFCRCVQGAIEAYLVSRWLSDAWFPVCSLFFVFLIV